MFIKFSKLLYIITCDFPPLYLLGCWKRYDGTPRYSAGIGYIQYDDVFITGGATTSPPLYKSFCINWFCKDFDSLCCTGSCLNLLTCSSYEPPFGSFFLCSFFLCSLGSFFAFAGISSFESFHNLAIIAIRSLNNTDLSNLAICNLTKSVYNVILYNRNILLNLLIDII